MLLKDLQYSTIKSSHFFNPFQIRSRGAAFLPCLYITFWLFKHARLAPWKLFLSFCGLIPNRFSRYFEPKVISGWMYQSLEDLKSKRFLLMPSDAHSHRSGFFVLHSNRIEPAILIIIWRSLLPWEDWVAPSISRHSFNAPPETIPYLQDLSTAVNCFRFFFLALIVFSN